MTSKNKNSEEEVVSLKTIGMIFKLVALPMVITAAILLSIPKPDLVLTGGLISLGGLLFFLGLLASSALSKER